MGTSPVTTFVLTNAPHLSHPLASRLSRRSKACPAIKCEATPSNLTPLLEAARDRLRPLGLNVPSLTWHRPVLTVYISRDSTGSLVSETDDTMSDTDSGMTTNLGVSVDDCAEAATLLNMLLDGTEPGAEETASTINKKASTSTLFPEQSYTLEVSSTGVSETLQSPLEFAAFRGFPVRVTCAPRRKKKSGVGKLDEATKTSDDKLRVILGRLGNVTDDSITVNVKGRVAKIVRSDLFDIKLVTASEIGEQDE